MPEIKLPLIRCEHCGYAWHPRTNRVLVCANCHNPVMVEVDVPTITCEQCGHTWTPRSPRPRKCPNCQSFEFAGPPELAPYEEAQTSE